MKQERNMFIVHCHDLNQDIERYKEMFPDSYTSYDAVKERLQTRMDDPVLDSKLTSKRQGQRISFTWVHGNVELKRK